MRNHGLARADLARLRRRQAAVRGLLSRRDALCALLASTAPTLGCEGTAQPEAREHEPYLFGPEADQAAGGGASQAAGGSADQAAGGGAGGEVAGAAGAAQTGGSADGPAVPGQHCLNGQSECARTEDNILGPFYRPDAPFRTDLTAGVSVTEPLEVRGRVMACDCETPLAGATIDVWQADEDGGYDNAGYLLRGRIRTDAEGNYQYLSVLPGAYLNGAQYRPKHVHYKVSHPDAETLVTQLYFQGDPHLPTDPFVRDALVMPLSEDNGIYRVTFDIVLV